MRAPRGRRAADRASMTARDSELSGQLLQDLAVSVEETEAGGALGRHLHLDARVATPIHEPHGGCAVVLSADPDALPIVAAGDTVGHAQPGHPVLTIIHSDESHDLIGAVLVERQSPAGVFDLAPGVLVSPKDQAAVFAALIVIDGHP